MHAQRFDDLRADREDRVERGHRLLENEANLGAANGAHVAFAQFEEIAAPIETDWAAVDLPRRLHEPQNRQRGHRLAATRLTDDAQRLSTTQLEADVIDGPHGAAGNLERCGQVLDAKESSVSVHHVKSASPNTSRSASEISPTVAPACTAAMTSGTRFVSPRAAL
jgi:hypothetical protein